MADRIVASSEAFEACVASYKGSLEKLQGAVSTYEQALEALRNDYTGRAFVAMAAKVVAMSGKIKASFERVHDAITELEAADKVYTENETSIANDFKAVEVGTKSPFAG